MDGSQKLPQRLLGTMQDRLFLGLPIDTHALSVASWMHYVAGADEHGLPVDVRDPLASELAETAKAAGPMAERLAPALLSMRPFFGALGADPCFCNAITAALTWLTAIGAHRAVQA